ncbi:MAG: transcriptional regulator of aroF, aroG, tyrA and aromatic amino acid transport [Alphaproteobacteria bacterium]|jgi:transcriptional regulator of aroF, aroG, tyrA and aromatic amino acid transport
MRLEISCEDRMGITQDVLDILNEYDIDLRGIEIDELGKLFLDFPSIEFSNFQDLMPKLRRVEGIVDVRTTPFMPIQRERNQLRTLLETLPDPVFSTDANGKIILYNEVVASTLEMSSDQIRELHIDDLIQGFNVTKWLHSKSVDAQTHKVQFIQQDYIADLLPVNIPDNGNNILAGAVVMLKSEVRLGAQINAFRKPYSGSFDNFEANSTAMKRVIREAKRMSDLDGNILITGDTGTGKEQIAKACHDNSRRSDGEFVSLNCASLPDEAAETELFGYAQDSLDKSEGKLGLFEQAAGGTILFDEVSEMSAQLQAKLLRVLEYGTYHQLGDSRVKYIDCRIICTSCKDLSQCVQDGTFREDLYYRLNVLGLVVPSLRERKADIISLANNIVQQHSKKLSIQSPKLSKPCIDYLESYPWPGNIRQLKNALYRAISLMDGNEITKEAIQLPSCTATVTYIDENFDGTLEQEVKRFERDMLKRLYPSYPSTRQLARKLGLSHTAIANKLREYGISKHSVKMQ